ncbi:MAG: secretion protein HlyD [Holophagaceae bacterium]|nr:secretion protein HlyD [Holophagaceae bacterium]
MITSHESMDRCGSGKDTSTTKAPRAPRNHKGANLSLSEGGRRAEGDLTQSCGEGVFDPARCSGEPRKAGTRGQARVCPGGVGQALESMRSAACPTPSGPSQNTWRRGIPFFVPLSALGALVVEFQHLRWKPLIIAGVLASGLACQRREQSEPDTSGLPTARVQLVQSGPTEQQGWVAGTLTSTQRATLSTRMAASVRKVHVSEGAKVTAGTLLVSLADDDLQGGLKAAEAGLAAAKAHHQRISNLAQQGAATPSELEMAQSQLAQAQAGVSGVKANLAFTQIRAPFSGVIQARRVNEGDFVGPGAPLVELEGQGALELTASLSESESKGLRMGQKLPFEVEGVPGQAEITALAPGGDPISHRSALRARVLKGGPAMRTGSFARLLLPTQAQAGPNTPFVPQSALVQRGELNGVFVAKDGKAQLRWLSLGERQGDRYPVRAGLQQNESIINNPSTLKDGQPIEVAK